MTVNPLCLLSDHMKNFWAYEYDQNSRDEMIRLSPTYSQVVTVTIEDLNMGKNTEIPSNFGNYNNYSHGNNVGDLKNTSDNVHYNYNNGNYSSSIEHGSNNGIFYHLHNVNNICHHQSNNGIVDLTDDSNSIKNGNKYTLKYEIKNEIKSENKSKNEHFIQKIKQNLFKRAQERQKFNFYLSESRTKRFGGVVTTESVSSSSATSNELSTVGGAAIAFNWRIVNAVTISLPIEQSMKARSAQDIHCSLFYESFLVHISSYTLLHMLLFSH